MSQLISFPGLGLEFTINRVAFSLGNYDIYWYGLTFATGFIIGLAYYYTHLRWAGVHEEDGLDVIIWSVLFGMVGARLYYVAFQWDNYKDNLLKIFALREGGLAFYGGLIGAVVAGLIVCKMKNLPLLPLLDVGLPGYLIAQCIGRWGNFFNVEAFGCNTDLPWGMYSPATERYLKLMQETLAAEGMNVDPTAPVHPTFLYESLWDFVGFVIIIFVINRIRKCDGQLTMFTIAWNGFGRFFIESLRTDSLMLGPIRVSQFLGALMFVYGVIMYYILSRKQKNQKEVTENQTKYVPFFSNTSKSKERMGYLDKKAKEQKTLKHCEKQNTSIENDNMQETCKVDEEGSTNT